MKEGRGTRAQDFKETGYIVGTERMNHTRNKSCPEGEGGSYTPSLTLSLTWCAQSPVEGLAAGSSFLKWGSFLALVDVRQNTDKDFRAMCLR